MQSRALLLLFLLAPGLFLSGCVSMSEEVPQLSAEIGKRIIESKSSHLALVRQYMNEKRERIDEFIEREWIPEFAEEAFKQPAISHAWDSVVQSNSKQKRLKFIVGLGVRIQQKINRKRQELTKPVDELEALLIQGLETHYNEMITANSTLTTYLDSAVSVKERQGRAMKLLKVDGSKLTGYLASADKIVGNIVSGKHAIDDNREKIEGILGTVRKAIGG